MTPHPMPKNPERKPPMKPVDNIKNGSKYSSLIGKNNLNILPIHYFFQAFRTPTNNISKNL
ncbi:hypothetical protein FACS1894113_4280 [Alphaproteobacteria bacterium]|nr:hypothetical protein FACS1894113_4280 [Alphaproteobacteria bacterium]